VRWLVPGAAITTALAAALATGAARDLPSRTSLAVDWHLAGKPAQGGLVFGTAPAGTVRLTLDGVGVRLAGDGRFVIGFGRNAMPVATLVAELPGGVSVVERVTVASRDWQVEAIPSLAQSTTPDPEYDARRAAELARIAAARAGETDAAGWTQPFRWPTHGRIAGVYGSQRILGGVPKSPHYGVDIAAPAGTPVAAPADGIVRFADGPLLLEGNLVLLDHGHGLASAFLHLSRIDVHAGDTVRRGEPLGTVGRTGRATGPHLHWGMTWGTVRVDPQLLVTGAP